MCKGDFPFFIFNENYHNTQPVSLLLEKLFYVAHISLTVKFEVCEKCLKYFAFPDENYFPHVFSVTCLCLLKIAIFAFWEEGFEHRFVEELKTLFIQCRRVINIDKSVVENVLFHQIWEWQLTLLITSQRQPSSAHWKLYLIPSAWNSENESEPCKVKKVSIFSILCQISTIELVKTSLTISAWVRAAEWWRSVRQTFHNLIMWGIRQRKCDSFFLEEGGLKNYYAQNCVRLRHVSEWCGVVARERERERRRKCLNVFSLIYVLLLLASFNENVILIYPNGSTLVSGDLLLRHQ